MTDKKPPTKKTGHVHGPGCGHDHHGHGHDHHHEPQSKAELEAAATVSKMLKLAGYDVTNAEEFKRGAAALMAAQMVAVSAGLAGKPGAAAAAAGAKIGRNDPCPCGSGKKYKKCCLDETGGAKAPSTVDEFGGVRPGMIPHVALESMQSDTATLGRLFKQDPLLKRCRYDAASMATYLEPHATRVPADLAERDRWIALRAHEYVTNEYETDGDDASSIQTLSGLKEALCSAAPRSKDDDDELRALGLGLLYHSSWSPGLEEPHPLETMLFRLTLQETAVDQQARASLMTTLGEDADAVAQRLAAGDPEAARQWQESFDDLPEEKRVELLQAAERYHDRVVEALVSGSFPVPLPLVSVLPLVIETVAATRDADDEDAARDAARELAIRIAKEGLSSGDRALYVELCDEWIDSDEVESEDQADQVRYARGLAAVGASSLEPVLLLAFLDHHRVSPLPEEPSPNPDEGQEIDSPAFLEQYGLFLADRGLLDLALRTWALCRFAGEIPEAVQAHIQRTEAELSAKN